MTPGGPDDEEEKRDVDGEVQFLQEVFPNFDTAVIEKVLKQMDKFDHAFKHLQEFFELVTTNEFGKK